MVLCSLPGATNPYEYFRDSEPVKDGVAMLRSWSKVVERNEKGFKYLTKDFKGCSSTSKRNLDVSMLSAMEVEFTDSSKIKVIPVSMYCEDADPGLLISKSKCPVEFYEYDEKTKTISKNPRVLESNPAARVVTLLRGQARYVVKSITEISSSNVFPSAIAEAGTDPRCQMVAQSVEESEKLRIRLSSDSVKMPYMIDGRR